MDYEDMIEDEPKPVTEVTEADVEPDTADEPRAKSPWKAFILTGVLAGIIGAGAGGYGAYAALKTFAPAPAAQVETDLSPIETELQRLANRVTEVETLADRPVIEAEAVSVEPVDLSGLEDRLTALETAPSPDIDPEALTALKAAQADGFEWPETEQIETVLTQLDERLASLETGLEASTDADKASVNAEMKASLQDIDKRVGSLESEPNELLEITARIEKLENRPAPTPIVERVSILAFPKAQMIEAVEANMEGGILQKTLSRHIRVKDSDDPLTLIDGIENDLSAGRLAAAAEKFERLPSPVRSKGQAWYESVKASL